MAKAKKAKELQELGKWKVGQKVTLRGNNSLSIKPITKITDGRGGTIYAGDYKFDERGRERTSDSWHFRTITLTTDEDRLEIAGKNARNKLYQVEWQKLDYREAIAIEQFLNMVVGSFE
jgi:hypothetical protein